jgi:hypothetical protein
MKMKKVLLSILILTIISCTALANEMRVPVEKGWNLIYGLNTDKPVNKVLAGSEIQVKNIKAIFLYVPPISAYARLFPNPETKKIIDNLETNDLENGVYWVYSDKKGLGIFNVDEPMEFTDRGLVQGWNFYPIYENMVGKKPAQFAGTCEIEKAYGFEPTKQQWVNLIDEEMQKEALGLGIVVKVKNECKFGDVEEPIAPVPQLPN